MQSFINPAHWPFCQMGEERGGAKEKKPALLPSGCCKLTFKGDSPPLCRVLERKKDRTSHRRGAVVALGSALRGSQARALCKDASRQSCVVKSAIRIKLNLIGLEEVRGRERRPHSTPNGTQDSVNKTHSDRHTTQQTVATLKHKYGALDSQGRI